MAANKSSRKSEKVHQSKEKVYQRGEIEHQSGVKCTQVEKSVPKWSKSAPKWGKFALTKVGQKCTKVGKCAGVDDFIERCHSLLPSLPHLLLFMEAEVNGYPPSDESMKSWCVFLFIYSLDFSQDGFMRLMQERSEGTICVPVVRVVTSVRWRIYQYTRERTVQLDVSTTFTGEDSPLSQHKRPCASKVSHSEKNLGRSYFGCKERLPFTFFLLGRVWNWISVAHSYDPPASRWVKKRHYAAINVMPEGEDQSDKSFHWWCCPSERQREALLSLYKMYILLWCR